MDLELHRIMLILSPYPPYPTFNTPELLIMNTVLVMRLPRFTEFLMTLFTSVCCKGVILIETNFSF